jgi:putative alpha-1,2-mannosidase
LYQATPDGYCGDEDNGQTSAWYVFSAMGFYPVCPASTQYVFGAPLFKKITLNLENGKQFVINAPDNDPQNMYVQKMTLDGKVYDKNWIDHFDILKGGSLNVTMGDQPNKSRGTKEADFPYSFSTRKQ